jgi:transposase
VRESGVIDSSLGAQAMPKPYSDDLRERVIEAVEAGASRREAAENFNLSPSSAVKWLKRWRDTGSAKARPTGGSTSPLEEHAEWLLVLVTEQPDLTLDEIVAAMRKRQIPGSRTAVWRFFARHQLTVKKKEPARGRRTWPAHAAAGGADSSCLTRPGWCSSTKRPPAPRW